MTDMLRTKIGDLELWFPPYYGDEEYDTEYPVDIDAVIDGVNSYIDDRLYDLDFNSEFMIEFSKSNLRNHYDSSYVRADANMISDAITLWEYICDVIVIDDIYDSVEFYESGYANLISETLKKTVNVDLAFNKIEEEIRLNKKYEYDEHKQWFENDFVYRRDLCMRAIAALNSIFEYVNEVNEGIADIVKNA